MRNLVEHYHRNGKNFCVITPYDAQKAEIARDLESVGLPSDRVFNVDSFQGMLSHLIPHLFLEK